MRYFPNCVELQSRLNERGCNERSVLKTWLLRLLSTSVSYLKYYALYTSIGRDSYSVHYDWSAQSNCLVTIVPSRSIRVLFTQSFIVMSLILFVYLWIFLQYFVHLFMCLTFVYLFGIFVQHYFRSFKK